MERERIEPLECGEGLDREEWAEKELGGARLGDRRLSRRLVRSASVQAEAPMASFSSAAQSDKAMVMGYYRMIDQPADSEVTPDNILAPHRARTLRRMQGKAVVLCLQDGTDLNFAEHEGCRGLGLIRKNQSGAGTLGLHLHSTLVVDGEGVPLGVAQLQYEAPEATKQKRKPAPERKTQRWGDDPAGPGEAGTAGRGAVLRHGDPGPEGLRSRPQAVPARQSRRYGGDPGKAGRIS